MFLSAMTGSVVALALVAGVTGFDGGFVVFAVLLLAGRPHSSASPHFPASDRDQSRGRGLGRRNEPVRGTPTSRRRRNSVLLRDRLDRRRGRDHDDLRRPARTGFLGPQFVTTPGLIATVDGVVAGVLVAIVALQIGLDTEIQPRGCRCFRPRDDRTACCAPVPARGPHSGSGTALPHSSAGAVDDKSVAQSALRADVARALGIVAELVAQPADVDAQVVDLVDVLAAPDLRQQRPVLQDVPGLRTRW